ncbi:MAG: SCP2 sterol-binding domain-containing protein [Betaproteobacteria bacterium]|nr:SCP2 sterol-binding domain-containing protein [Betaproteobacteria bacterium]
MNLPRIPLFVLPEFFAGIGASLPQWPHSVALVAALNLAARCGVLPQDELAALEGRTFLIHVRDTGARAEFFFRDGAFRPCLARRQDAAPADLAFSANLCAFLQLLTRQEDPDTLFFKRELSITGDTELGLRVKNMLDAVECPQHFPPLARLRELTGKSS